MWKLLILACLGTCFADDCWVGDWTEWSNCKPATTCDTFHDYNPKSFELAAAEWDEGRLKMEYMMKVKQAHFDSIRACLADGTCPEYAPKESMFQRFDCIDGKAAGIFDCEYVDLMSFMSFADLGSSGAGGNDVWGWFDAENNKEYAIMGLTTGTSFVDVTEPTNPVLKYFLPSHTVSSTWRDIKVIGHTAYIVAEASAHGMQVFDLRQLSGSGPFQAIHYPRFGNAHNIVANEDTHYVYGVGSTRNVPGGVDICSGGLHIIDVIDPDNPQYVTCFGGDGYVHDAECVIYHGPDSRFYGREVFVVDKTVTESMTCSCQICFCYNENTLTIVDVEDKNNVYMISKRGYSGSQYTHQGWLLDDHASLLLDDELDESRSTDKRTRTYFWDINDLTNPILRRVFYSNQHAIDHNQYIKDGLSFQANYEAGLRILYINDFDYTLHEIAYFDIFPQRTTANFNGAWSTYIYLPSGNILVSSINDGLFVLRPEWEAIRAIKEGASGLQQRSRPVYGEDLTKCPAAQEYRDCDASC